MRESTPPGTTLVWSPDLTAYDFGPEHPMAPIRLDLTHSLLEALGVLDDPRVRIVEPEAVGDSLLESVHDPAYVAAVRAAGDGVVDEARGLGTTDTPIYPLIHDASARLVGGSIAAARAVWSGATSRAVNFGGGMHHAMPGVAAGFCVYNDLAVAIQWLLDAGARRVLYVDVDAHHGDGVERAFWDSDRVLTFSIHESGRTLFPGTGHASDIGAPGGEGHAVNIALPAYVRGDAWLRAIEAVLPAVAREFVPDVIVSQHGCDAHGRDPLTNLEVSIEHQRAAAILIRDLADEVATGRWIATGGGGYAVADVVPRVWAHLVAVSAGIDVDPGAPTPAAWREHVEQAGWGPAPQTMGDGEHVGHRPWSRGWDPSDPVDQAVVATRNSAFPHLGLDAGY